MEITCWYGIQQNIITVTDKVLRTYGSHNPIFCDLIHFPPGNKYFNEIFGDPCPGHVKKLFIKFKTEMVFINENDIHEYTYNISSGKLHNIDHTVFDSIVVNDFARKDINAYRQHMKSNIDNIYKAKKIVTEKNTNYFDLTILNDIPHIDVSIVMTTYNRSEQTYFTLQTIMASCQKNLQVIIVDDSNTDLLDLTILEKYGICIYHIKTKNKFWFNPCINYNLGFQFIRGQSIIIQNAEVCHIGDVTDYVVNHLSNNKYLVFDVAALPSMNINHIFYQSDISYDNYPNMSQLFSSWYQHHITSTRNLHFLTAIDKQTFDTLDGFDYDFCMGSWYDDNELVFRIEATGIDVILVAHNVDKIMGIHQWHVSSMEDWDKNVIRNLELFNAKQQYMTKNKSLFYLTDYPIADAAIQIDKLFS